jgi:GT2 family glycosyltransferase
MESLQVAVPVVGFAGAGGFTELLDDGCGVCVPMGNVDAFAQAVETLLNDPDRALALGERGRSLVEDQFSFRGYMFDLLAMLGVDIPRVSVVVPNYNYAHLLSARLASIADQSHPFFELIVLDDCSSDNSLDVIPEFANGHSVHVRCIACERNSGSVFRQWHKGVALARGEYVWIAEADDLVEPDFLEQVLRAMRDPRIVLAYTQSKQMDQDGRLIAGDYRDYTRDVSEDRWAHAYSRSGREEITQCLAIKNTIPNVSAALFRRDVLLLALEEHLEEVCSFRIAGDWVTYLAVLEKGDIAFIPEALNLHRRHGSSVTLGGDHLSHLREVLRVQAMVRQRYRPGTQVLDRASAYVDHLCSHFGMDLDVVKRLQRELDDEVKM